MAGLIKLLSPAEPLTQPPYVSSVTLELSKSETAKNSTSTKYYVRMFIKFNMPNQPIRLRLVQIGGNKYIFEFTRTLFMYHFGPSLVFVTYIFYRLRPSMSIGKFYENNK